MKNLKQTLFAVLILVAFGATAQTDKDQKIMNDADQAKESLITADAGIADFFKKAHAYVIFPNVGEGGFIIGGASGNGVVYEDDIAIGMADLKKLDVGFQVGGQAVIEVIFFEDDEALAKFKESKFEFTAEASAVAVESGVSANANYDDGVIVFALPKAGLMADASIGGQKFKFKSFK